jgi:hypothetical protein
MRGKGDARVYVFAHVDDLLSVRKPEAVRQLKRNMDTNYTMVWTVNTRTLELTITNLHKDSVCRKDNKLGSQKGYREGILKRFETHHAIQLSSFLKTVMQMYDES